MPFWRPAILINFGFVCIFWNLDDGFQLPNRGTKHNLFPIGTFESMMFRTCPFGGICYLQFPWRVLCLIGGFLKWWYPTTMGFPTKNGPFWGGDWGYHHWRKHLYVFKAVFGIFRVFSMPLKQHPTFLSTEPKTIKKPTPLWSRPIWGILGWLN